MGNYDHVVVKKIVDRDGDLAVIPIKVMSGIKSYTGITLKFGSFKRAVDVLPALDSGILLLTEKLINEMNIYEGFEVDIRAQGSSTIQMGPLVGIFVNKGTMKRIREGNPTNRTAEIVKGARSKCLVYFFSIDSINWPQNYIEGFTYHCDSNNWQQQRFPLPDILYDRGGGFLRNQMVKAKYIRNQLDNFKELKRFNAQYFFDKWNLYYTLNEHDEIKQYLPDTKLYRELSDIEEMIDTYLTIYLKVYDGSNGNGVIRVKKTYNNGFEYSYFTDKLILGFADSIGEIVNVSKKVMKKKPFIVQQGIDVITFEGNNVDIRILAQRDGAGKWGITAMPVRVALDNCAITSTRSGSTVYTFNHGFQEVLNYSSDDTSKIKTEIEKLIYTVIDFIEMDYGRFGELGIDVALDKNGKLWFIEANAKPGKDTIMLSGDEEGVIKAFTLPFEYCRLISGFME